MSLLYFLKCFLVGAVLARADVKFEREPLKFLLLCGALDVAILVQP